ncbi:MAG TPA: hypothetical protein PLB73_16205, partial [Leptospiraceae bacterium]|nr:hypothetical protein [Leptospiraceae bacterium]
AFADTCPFEFRPMRALPSILLVFFGILVSCQTQTRAPEALPSILIVGDSIILGKLGEYLETELGRRGHEVHRHAMVSSGLSGLHDYNWPEATYDYIDRYHPDLLIAMFGANDSLAVKNYADDAKFTFFSDSGFRERYARKVRLFLSLNAPRVKTVYWVGQPNLDHHELTPKFPVLNEIYAQEVARVPNGVFIPVWDFTSNAGKYKPVMADATGVVGPLKWDFVHFTPHGGKVLGDHIIEAIYNHRRSHDR